MDNKWSYDPILKKLFNNASILFGGNAASSLIGLVSLAITARSLGLEQFGILVLITTYVLIVDKLINFQSWQVLIKYGADALEQKREEDFKSLIKFGYTLDVSTAIIGAILAVGGVWLIGGWIGLKQEHKLIAAAYCLTIVFHVSGTPIAILRLFDKYKKTAIQQVYASGFKLIGVSLAFILGADLWWFLLVWALAEILGNILLNIYAYKELTHRNINHLHSSSTRNLSGRFKGIWGFVWTTNLHSSIKIGLSDVDIIIISILIGSSGAGIYKIVKLIGSTLSKISDPFYQAVYPNLATAFSSKKSNDFFRVIFIPMKFMTLITLIAIGVFFAFGQPLIEFILGAEYLLAYYPALIYSIGAFIAMVTFGFHPALLSTGRAKISFYILIFCTIVYLSLIFPLVAFYGLTGAAMSYVLFYLLWASIQFMVINFIIKKEFEIG